MAGLGTWRFGTRGVTMEAVWWHAWSACSWSGVRAAGGHSPGASVSKERGPYVSSRNARPERRRSVSGVRFHLATVCSLSTVACPTISVRPVGCESARRSKGRSPGPTREPSRHRTVHRGASHSYALFVRRTTTDTRSHRRRLARGYSSALYISANVLTLARGRPCRSSCSRPEQAWSGATRAVR